MYAILRIGYTRQSDAPAWRPAALQAVRVCRCAAHCRAPGWLGCVLIECMGVSLGPAASKQHADLGQPRFHASC